MDRGEIVGEEETITEKITNTIETNGEFLEDLKQEKSKMELIETNRRQLESARNMLNQVQSKAMDTMIQLSQEYVELKNRNNIKQIGREVLFLVVSEGIVTRTACAVSYTEGRIDNPCIEEMEIQVKNCSGFTVYNLPPVPYCDMAYCFEQKQWDPCSTTSVLGDLPKRSTSQTSESPDLLSLDYTLIDDWYRVDGYDMPTEPVYGQGHCSTAEPLWLNGPIPDVTEGVTSRTVCSSSSHDSYGSAFRTCNHYYESIKIKNCGLYMAYKLHRLYDGRKGYCFDPLNVTGNGTIEYLCDTTQVLSNMNSRIIGQNSSHFTDDDMAPEWYRVDGMDIPTEPPPPGSCGAESIFWLQSYSTIPEESEGVVLRYVCTGNDICDCQDQTEIEMKTCVGFRIYKLQPSPIAGYCFGDVMDVLDWDPCSTSFHLENLIARTSYSGDMIDDSTLVPYWYRVDGYDMLTAPRNACNTGYKFWMNGTIPKVSEGIVSRRTCHFWGNIFDDSDMYCWYDNVQIKVKNCGDYRVYRLRRICWGPSAYCFEPSSKENVSDSDLDSSVEVVLRNATVTNTDLVFECMFEAKSNFIYNISWFADGALLKNTDLLTMKTLHQHYLYQNEIKEFDITIHCTIEQRDIANGADTSTRMSEGKFIGIKVETPILKIPRGDTGQNQVILKSTIPIRCSKSSEGGSCSLIIQQQELEPEVCHEWDLAFKNKCRLTVGSLESADTMSFGISIRSQLTTKNFGSMRIIHLQMNSNDKTLNRLWKGYPLQSIMVNVYDASRLWTNKECYAHADPHMRNFDGLGFEYQMKAIFYLYMHTELPQEVQVQTELCSSSNWWGRNGPYCVCGVAVRAEDDVFIYSVCKSPGFIGKLQCNRNILEVREWDVDGSYKIFLPTGTVVHIYPLWGHILNVKITPSASDFLKTCGLCGLLSDNTTDDFFLRNSTEYDNNIYEPNDFSMSWSVPPEEDLFDTNMVALNILSYKINAFLNEDQDMDSCMCRATDAANKITEDDYECSKKIYNKCDQDELLITRESIFMCIFMSFETTFRHRREVSRRFKRAVPRLIRSTENPGSGNWTEESAEAYCRSAFENKTSYTTCTNHTNASISSNLDNCKRDILMTGDTVYVTMSVDLFERSCIIQLENTGKPAENDTDDSLQKIKTNVMQNFCPNDCHGNGQCVEGTCHTNLTCRITGTTVSFNGESEAPSTLEINGKRISRFEVSCPLPNQSQNFAAMYNISVSNTGIEFGDEWEMIVYNERHVLHHLDNGLHKFTLNDTSCYIDGQFYESGESDSNNPLHVCDVRQSQYEWTDDALFYRSQVTLNVSEATWTNNQDPVYISITGKTETALIDFFKTELQDMFVGVNVLDIRHGSLIVDYNIHIISQPAALTVFTTAVISLINGDGLIIYGGSPVSVLRASIVVDGGTVTLENSNFDSCRFFLALTKCEDNFECAVDSKGYPYCKELANEELLTMILAISISTCGVLGIVLVLCLVLKQQNAKKMQIQSESTSVSRVSSLFPINGSEIQSQKDVQFCFGSPLDHTDENDGKYWI
ncbi:hypothetical protein ScPMuIL_008296 [Solemya velum]